MEAKVEKKFIEYNLGGAESMPYLNGILCEIFGHGYNYDTDIKYV